MAADLIVDERRELPEVCRTLHALGHLPRNGGVWWPENLRKIMTHEARTGVVIWGKPHPEIERYSEPVVIPDVPAVLTEERLQDALAHRRSRPPQAKRTYPLSGRIVSACGRSYIGYGQADRSPRYKCQGSVWSPAPDWVNCHCPRIEAADAEGRVWAEVTALLTSPERLRALADEYLGVAEGDGGGQAAEVAWLDGQITQLRGRMTTQVASLIKAGLDAQVVSDAVAQLEDELALLSKRRSALAARLAEGEQARDRVSSLDRLAEQAAGRLATITLAEQAETLALLDVRVEVTADGLRFTGTVCELELPVEPGPTGTKVLHSHSPPAETG